MKEAGLYLHIPYCPGKCHYCAFNSRSGSRAAADDYLLALGRQLRAEAEKPWSRTHTFPTIFVGGGTPTLASPGALVDLLALARASFAIPRGAEISIEANPGTVDQASLATLREGGYNRLSLGVQSFSDSLLRSLGRLHTASQAREAVAAARGAGFSNINLDLIYGLPGQELGQWRRSLEAALALKPTHLALYELTVEPDSAFGRKARQGRLELPGEEAVADMEELSRELLALAGYQQYEISNYSLAGCQCRHNVNYWQNGPYLGLGAGAVSYLAGRRLRAAADAKRYMELVAAGADVWLDEEQLEPAARFRETVIMGLRLTAGLDIAALESASGLTLTQVYGPLIAELTAQGLLIRDQDHLRLPAALLPLANQVLSRLV
ncbi:MAG: radical SAM family heme chaperone HemW [Thermodesulfobacteriota bacterium]